MDDLFEENQNDSLAHYASKYYDPVKAHEYYEEHKKLKGRRSTSTLNEEGRQVWGYAKTQISNEKKAKSKSLSEDYKAKVQDYRASAKEAKERISAELKEKLTSITDSAQKQKVALAVKQAIEKARIGIASGKTQSTISSQAENRIEQLQSMAGNATGEAKGRIQKQIDDIRESRDEDIAVNKVDSTEQRADLSESYGSSKAEISNTAAIKKFNARLEAAAGKEEIRRATNESISKAREELKNSKSELTKTYEVIFDTEYDKIHADYGTDNVTQIDPALQQQMEARAEARRKKLRDKWNKIKR